jgi:hypothetical protein
MSDITVEKSGNSTNGYAFQRLDPDTLVHTLFDAIENEWSDNALEVVLKQLSRKGFDQRQLLFMIEEKFGKPAALKIIRIISRQ